MTSTYHLKSPVAMGGGTRVDINAHMVMGTTFYFTTKTTSPLGKLLGNKFQESIAANSTQVLIHLLTMLL